MPGAGLALKPQVRAGGNVGVKTNRHKRAGPGVHLVHMWGVLAPPGKVGASTQVALLLDAREHFKAELPTTSPALPPSCCISLPRSKQAGEDSKSTRVKTTMTVRIHWWSSDRRWIQLICI